MATPLTGPLVDLIAERFRVLGEPSRIKILDRLRRGEATVHQLASDLEMTQQNVSKHLGVLRQAGMVAREREGNYARHRIADEQVFDLCAQVCGGLERRLAELERTLAVTR